eukprot:983985-Pelagomonas_calceolata.AAC.1
MAAWQQRQKDLAAWQQRMDKGAPYTACRLRMGNSQEAAGLPAGWRRMGKRHKIQFSKVGIFWCDIESGFCKNQKGSTGAQSN